MAEQLAAAISPNQISSTVEKWCSSHYTFSRFIYTWTIDGFRTKVMLNDDYLAPIAFSEEVPRKMRWQLQIKPNVRRDSKFCVEFGIILIRGDGQPINAVLEFATLNPQGGKDLHRVEKKRFQADGDDVWFAYDRKAVLSDTKPIVYDERLTLRVEINVINFNFTSGQSNSKFHEIKLSEDYGQLLESESLSDLTLIVGSRSFRAHKVVLAARSSVFAAMFQHDMLEKAKSSVTITDIDPEVFAETLRFIYTGMVSNNGVLDTMALELLAAADKYALDQLKQLCEDFLKKTLSTESAAETLIVAELCNAADLKARAIDFIKGHTAQVMLSSGWFKMISYPQILREFSTETKD